MARKVATKQNIETKSRTYFKSAHRDVDYLHISSVYYKRRKNYVHVSYKLQRDPETGKPKLHRSPRPLCQWLDKRDDDFIDNEIETWKIRVNTAFDKTSERCQPEFYLKHLTKFLTWLDRNNVQIRTIEKYKFELERYVFPYFVALLGVSDPKSWKDHYFKWYEWINMRRKTANGRKKPITALRRYLDFLKSLHHDIGYVLPEAGTNRNHKPEFLPGDGIPSIEEALNWIQQLPPSRNRWAIALMTFFGVRISESLALTHKAIIGNEDVKSLATRDPLIKAIMNELKPKLLLEVDKARKKPVSDQEIVRKLGRPEEEGSPKTRDYYAACLDTDCAKLLLEMVNAGEDNLGTATFNSVYRLIKNSSHPIFGQYAPHDFRRLHVTLLALETGKHYYVSKIHGHASEEVTHRYYREARKRLRHDPGKEEHKISLIETG